MKQQILNPRLKVTSTNLILKSFGSAYGGWVVAISNSLKSSTIISCGLGEDATFDIEMINEALYKMGCSRIKNEAIDIEVMYRKLIDSTDKQFSIDELCQIFKISKNDRHSSAEDAYTIALLFLKLKSRLGINI